LISDHRAGILPRNTCFLPARASEQTPVIATRDYTSQAACEIYCRNKLLRYDAAQCDKKESGPREVFLLYRLRRFTVTAVIFPTGEVMNDTSSLHMAG
jgi:hypothetical protein